MAFTSNIDNSNLQVLRDTAAANDRESLAKAAREFQSSENKKSQEATETLYNVKAGDKWASEHPSQELSKTQISGLGEELSFVYADSQDSLVNGRRLLSSGNIEDRLKGMQIITKSNNAIKDLKEDYMSLEDDLQTYMQSNALSSNTDDMLHDISLSYLDKKARVLSSKTAGKADDSQRYIEYFKEDGTKKLISIDRFKAAMKGGVPRVDITKWVEDTSKNLGISKVENKDGTFSTNVNDKAVDASIIDLLSDPKKRAALEQQLRTKDPESILKEMLTGSKPLNKSKEKTYRKPEKLPKESSSKKLAEQRSFDVDKAMSGLTSVKKLFLGRSPKYGADVFNGQLVKGVIIDGNDLVFSYNSGSQKIPYERKNINELLNQFTYGQDDDRKISSAIMDSAEPIDYSEGRKKFSGESGSESKVLKTVSDIYMSQRDKETGVISRPLAFAKALKAKLAEGGIDMVKVIGRTGFFESGDFKLGNTKYDLSKKSDVDKFLVDYSERVRAASGASNIVKIGKKINTSKYNKK